MRLGRAAVLCAGLLWLPATGHAQQSGLRGYYLNAGSWQGSSLFTRPGAFDFQRLRLMLEPRVGPFSLDVAYEHTLLLSERPAGPLSLLPGSAAIASGNRVDLDWTVDSGAHHLWRHRFDRLSAGVNLGPQVQLTVGRQAISWATTLYFTPTDPFAPFDPGDPFREYRAGVDALRLQYFPGPFTSVDIVLRPESYPDGHSTTALLRARISVSAWDLSAWAGALHDDPAAAIGMDRSLRGWVVRGDLSFRRGDGGGTVLRLAAGADRRLSLAGRDLYLLAEYQHDGFGAARTADLPLVLGSGAYRRGELQALGRDEALADASWQVHPLVSTELLTIVNLRDGSAFLAPALTASVSNEIQARLGFFLPAGPGGVRQNGFPQSEYGETPVYAYLAVTAFF